MQSTVRVWQKKHVFHYGSHVQNITRSTKIAFTCVWMQGGETATLARVPQNKSTVHRTGFTRRHQHFLLRNLVNKRHRFLNMRDSLVYHKINKLNNRQTLIKKIARIKSDKKVFSDMWIRAYFDETDGVDMSS